MRDQRPTSEYQSLSDARYNISTHNISPLLRDMPHGQALLVLQKCEHVAQALDEFLKLVREAGADGATIRHLLTADEVASQEAEYERMRNAFLGST